jgi:hypothetical protein
LFVCIICVCKYISEKEKSGYGAEPSKLYGTFVSSSEKKTEPEKFPAISLNVNAPYPLFSFSEIYLQTQMIHTNNILSKSTHSDTNLKCYGFQTP